MEDHPLCEEIHRQVTLRSLTAFFFDRFAIGLRWAAAQTRLGPEPAAASGG